MADETAGFSWLRTPPLRDGACITLVGPPDAEGVVRGFGGDLSEARPVSLAAVELLSVDEPAIAVRTVGEWLLVVEVNGWQGARPEVLRRVSAGGRVVSILGPVRSRPSPALPAALPAAGLPRHPAAGHAGDRGAADGPRPHPAVARPAAPNHEPSAVNAPVGAEHWAAAWPADSAELPAALAESAMRISLRLRPGRDDHLISQACGSGGAVAGPWNSMLMTGCNSIALGATPSWPWAKSKKPSPRTVTRSDGMSAGAMAAAAN
jgi:hypothetical protein